MFSKVNVPLIGVIENMSQLCITGNLKNYDNNVELFLNENKIDITENGDFKVIVDVFKGSGGELESNRLGVPLLGKIFIDPLLSECSDKGTPYTLSVKETENIFEFEKICKKITNS